MRRMINVILFSLGLCILHPVAVYADDWEVYVPEPVEDPLGYPAYTYPDQLSDDEIDEEWSDEIELINDLATGSDWVLATGSNAASPPAIMPLANYQPYDSSISTSVLSYFRDALAKLGAVHYVLFRSGQYSYRLVYADDLVYESGSFTSASADFISYDSRDYSWSSGSEGSFHLSASDYLVYSDLSNYPQLDSTAVMMYLIAFAVVVWLLFTVYRSLFSAGRFIL